MKNIIHHIYACILTGLLFISGEAFAQNSITVKGTVKDSNGEPVIGSTVMVDGSNTGVVTDKEGKYSITFRPKAGKASKLVFSSISYVTQSVEVGNRTVIDIVLEEDSKQLDEVIVVGYFGEDRREPGFASLLDRPTPSGAGRRRAGRIE